MTSQAHAFPLHLSNPSINEGFRAAVPISNFGITPSYCATDPQQRTFLGFNVRILQTRVSTLAKRLRNEAAVCFEQRFITFDTELGSLRFRGFLNESSETRRPGDLVRQALDHPYRHAYIEFTHSRYEVSTSAVAFALEVKPTLAGQ